MDLLVLSLAFREGVRLPRSLRKVMGQSQIEISGERGVAGSASFAAMFDAHVEEVYRFVYRRCRDHTRSEDITQETFMAAIRSTDDPASITVGWLITVARNRLFDELRRQLRYEDMLTMLVSGEADDYDGELVERIRVEAALNELRAEYRVVLTLHYIDGFTVPALAEHLDRSLKSVEGLVTRARRELRAKLGENAESKGSEQAGG